VAYLSITTTKQNANKAYSYDRMESIRMKITFDMQHDDLASDRFRVDRTSIRTAVGAPHFAYQQVPFLQMRTYDTEPRVIDNSMIFQGQWKMVLIEPSDLIIYSNVRLNSRQLRNQRCTLYAGMHSVIIAQGARNAICKHI
jgi:hypothetical protein